MTFPPRLLEYLIGRIIDQSESVICSRETVVNADLQYATYANIRIKCLLVFIMGLHALIIGSFMIMIRRED